MPRPKSCRTMVPVIRPTVATTASVESAEAIMTILLPAERNSSPAAAAGETLNSENRNAAAVRCNFLFGGASGQRLIRPR
jgi:hypothetical protein